MPLLHVVVAAAVAFSAPPSMVHHAVVSAAPTAHAPQRALLAQTLCRAPQVSPAARVSTPVEMSTKYTVAAGLTKKKKATPTLGENCGLPPCLQATHSLYLHALMSLGYKVGQRAPDTAVASGTTKSEQSLWDKIWGGKKK
ncbi:MAG: hypothetical protein SGPRY_013607 [Prymnesium sp.]